MIRRLGFEEESTPYEAGPQKARYWSEAWAASQLYCLNCAAPKLAKLANNAPVADFVCPECAEEYELKSTSSAIGKRVVDGAYKTMIERLAANNNPNLIVLSYQKSSRAVVDLQVIPKQFFVPAVIQERKPLASTARRAGWIGCNILLERIPDAGRIIVVERGLLKPKDAVLQDWKRVCFLREEPMAARGWLMDVMSCVEDLKSDEFALSDVYGFEDRLKKLYPENKHVREKMRQQLQKLRDQGFLEFLGDGRYRLRRH